MRSRQFILRCTAFFLLLVFSQKAGAGLLLHNFFHEEVSVDNVPGQEKEDNNDGYACSCVDDLQMPFTAAEEQVFPLPVLTFASPVIFFQESISFYTSIFSFLRGPPAVKAL